MLLSWKNNEAGNKKRTHLLGALLVGLLIGPALSSNAFAEIQPALSAAQVSAFGSLSESERINFLINLAKTGKQEVASLLLKKFPPQGPHAVNRKLFIEGLILVGRGDLTGACQRYRAALANDPQLTLVRTELAQTLVTLGEIDSAKHHLQLLAANAPDPSLAKGIRSFIDSVDAQSPFRFNGYVSLAPTTNLNNGSSHTKVWSPVYGSEGDISPSSQQYSGLGIATGISVGYSKRLGNNWQAVLAADVGASLYSNPDFDSVGFSQSVEMRYHLDQGYFGFGLVSSQNGALRPVILLNPQLSYLSYGPRVSLNYNLTQRDNLNASAVYEWRDYVGSTDLNGVTLLADAAWSHAIDPSLSFSLSGGYDKVNAETQFNGYRTLYGGLGVNKELPLGITLNATAQARFSVFDDVNPLAGVTREDQRYIGSATLIKRDLNILGFAPSLSYTYTLNKSNIALWDYDSHAIDIRLTKDF